MAPETFAEPDDDPAFLACVDRIIAGLIERRRPEEVYLVRIANWFDQKWLRFSGIGRVAHHGGISIHTALDEFSQDQLTFPPFTPNRVVTQHYFCRTTRGEFEEQAPTRLVHRAERAHSAKNLHRRIVDFSRSAAFLWFSSHSVSNGRGSVMAYSISPQRADAWYAALRYDGRWRLGQVKGVSRPDVEIYLGAPRRAADV